LARTREAGGGTTIQARARKNSSTRGVVLTAPRSQMKAKLGKGRTVTPRLRGGEGALRAARAAVKFLNTMKHVAAPLRNLGTHRPLGRGRNPRLRGKPREQARPPGAPQTPVPWGFCTRASNVGARGSPRVFNPPPSRARAAPCVWRAVAGNPEMATL
jgi:hypothetical protein